MAADHLSESIAIKDEVYRTDTSLVGGLLRGSSTMPCRPTETASWRRRGALWGLDVTRLAPPPEEEACGDVEPVPAWNVRCTTALLGPTARVGGLEDDGLFRRAPGVAAADGRAVDQGFVRVARTDDPTRKSLARALADAFRYSAEELLRGDRRDLGAYLDARFRRRLVAEFGDPARLRATPGLG